jgi:hypothetical protein
MQPDRLPGITSRHHPRPLMIIRDQLLVLPRESNWIREKLAVTADIFVTR